MPDIAIIGASGLTGSHLVRILSSRLDSGVIYPVGRRLLPQWPPMSNVRPVITPILHRLQDYQDMLAVDVLCSCFGSTQAKAGGKSAFRALDLDLHFEIIQAARAQGVQHLILQSSLGADTHSNNHYLRCKGEFEAKVLALGFTSTVFIQPSLLLGDRRELRPMEAVSRRVFGALAPLLPRSWRPVQAARVAQEMADCALSPSSGHRVRSNRDLF